MVILLNDFNFSGTTTTIPYDSCNQLRWNQTSELVAGSLKGATATQFDKAECLFIDENNTLYICDNENDRVLRWIEVADTGGTALPRPGHLTFDKFGSVYVAIRATNIVLRFVLTSFFGTTVAGSSTSGNENNELHESIDIIDDDDLNIYVVDSKNELLMKWPCSATMDFLMISNLYSDEVVVMIFAPNSTDAFYFSDKQNG
ncbi:unnamed protein product [Rotaria socialis]|uniref:Uncharacterized protein n=1 Tax=Rotaria socialis TaxID=392032 RepID=A0A818DZ53_9BILA|nr:unnamed protein product [Rotaria socialis]CAF3450545.1 unnamed protein product [Rotaria socialis]CAF3669283.1 unnamed protein product [Rotaria socialis]CAF3744584.1 unnamed protein product [Rotaria socialis]CAF4358517.1 unnamed protein product [Rotaria socialis]